MIYKFAALIMANIRSAAFFVNTVQAAATTTKHSTRATVYFGTTLGVKAAQLLGYVTLSGKDNLKILTFFITRSYVRFSGIAGNFMAESGLDPTIIIQGGHATLAQGFTPTSGVAWL